MLYTIGTTAEIQSLPSHLPEKLVTEIFQGLVILDSDYGSDRNYLQTGGYSILAETPEDISKLAPTLDLHTRPPEWATWIGTTGYVSHFQQRFQYYGLYPRKYYARNYQKGIRRMKTITTTLTTKAVFSDDNRKRYLLTKTWDESLPKLAIIMLAPSAASGIALDNTTSLVLNNADRLEFGSVAIVNLFATLNSDLTHAEAEDTENLNAILSVCQNADRIVYAPGVGKAASKAFQRRQEQVLTALLPYESKLSCLCNAEGKARLQHPLSPSVRTWHFSDLKVSELVEGTKKTITVPKKQKKLPKIIPATT